MRDYQAALENLRKDAAEAAAVCVAREIAAQGRVGGIDIERQFYKANGSSGGAGAVLSPCVTMRC
jgi:hypothetical protein